MSANTTNQQITYPVGTDLADNPTAFLDMLADVEGRLVQRYTSSADRLARNPTPATGELSFVSGTTWYDRWTGAKWIPATSIKAVKTADQSVNNTTVLVNDAELFIPLTAINTRYLFHAAVRYSTNTTADIKFTFTVPAGAGLVFGGIGADTAAAGTTNAGVNFTSSIGPATQPYNGGTEAWLVLHGSLLTAATTGNLQLQFAQAVANVSNTTVLNASWLRAEAVV